MPELAEIEATRLQVSRAVLNKEIIDVKTLEQGGGPRDGTFDEIIFDKDTVPDGETFTDALKGKVIVGIRRKGKQLWWELAHGKKMPVKGPLLLPVFAFGMTGNMLIKGSDGIAYKNKVHKGGAVAWPPKFAKCEIVLSDNIHVAFCDPRRLGKIALREDPLNSEPLRSFAPDAMLDMPSFDVLKTNLSSWSVGIKAVLMDQRKLICGLGNWMVDEVLYWSKVHPETPSNHLSDEQIEAMRTKTSWIIKEAVEALEADREYPDDWIFTHRWTSKNKSASLNGEKIEKITVGGRATYFVPAVQKKSGDSESKPKRNKKKKVTTKVEKNSKRTEDQDDEEEEKKPKNNRNKKKKKQVKNEDEQDDKPASKRRRNTKDK